MAEFVTIARPYARALFSLAQQENQVEEYHVKLAELSVAVSDPKVSFLINDPGLTRRDRAEILLELVGGQQIDYLHNFVYILADNTRLVVLPYILELYEQLMDEATDTRKMTVYSAYELSDLQKEELLQTLGRRFKGHLEAQVKVDPELIGGVKIEVGDQVLDLSIQAQLKTLYSTVTN